MHGGTAVTNHGICLLNTPQHTPIYQRPLYAGAEGARGMLRMVQAKGAGYAISREEELEATLEVALATGALGYVGQTSHGYHRLCAAPPQLSLVLQLMIQRACSVKECIASALRGSACTLDRHRQGTARVTT